MKVLRKDKVLSQNLTRYAKTERNVLSIMDHPFIVKLSYAFQTDTKLYLLLDYCPGWAYILWLLFKSVQRRYRQSFGTQEAS